MHCQPAGRGEQVLDYLGRYVFRVALSNSRLEQIQDGEVTFRYRDNRTRALRRITLPGVDFLQRFLLHVLRPGCPKVRYYGLWSPTCRARLAHARTLLDGSPASVPDDPVADPGPDVPTAGPPRSPRCPHCKGRTLVVVAILPPHRSRSP